jgi:tetraacyldisaccharide 4'-kinase
MMIFPKTKPDWSRLHKEKTLGLWSLSMAFLSVLYGAGVGLRLWTYNRGLFRRRSLPGFGVSVGNITTGGTGKTPAVAMVAVWARKEGHRVAILSRGYGGTYKNEVLEVSDGRDIKALGKAIFNLQVGPLMMVESWSLLTSRMNY